MQYKIKKDYSRDSLLSVFALRTLRDRYMLPGEESPQDAFARVAWAFSDDLEHAQRLYDYASKLWLGFATPVLSNGGTDLGLPISCYLNDVGDSRKGLSNHYDENIWLSSNGGGIGGNWSNVRSLGTRTGRGNQTSGIIPFMHVVDSQMLAFHQGSTRRGSYAAYLDMSHPEIEEFIVMRKPTGGDPNRKNLNLHQGVNITDKFMEAVMGNKPWNLVDPHTNETRKTVNARDLWALLLETRSQVGEPYTFFIDNANKELPQALKDKGLKIQHSNLCCIAGSERVVTDRGLLTAQELYEQGEVLTVFDGEKPRITKTPMKLIGQDNLYKITLRNKMEHTVTGNHKVLTRQGLKELKDIKIGDEIVLQNKEGLFGSVEMEDEAFLLGMYRKALNFEKGHIPQWIWEGTKETQWQYIRGLFITDGTTNYNSKTQIFNLSFSDTDKDFLKDLQILLRNLGISTGLSKMSDEGYQKLPDGKGGHQDYYCKTAWRLTCGSRNEGLIFEKNTGFLSRKNVKIEPSRKSSLGYSEVIDIEEVGYDNVYCLEVDSTDHLWTVNGIITHNSEITLPTNENRTAVCCLSSVNLAKYREWQDDPKFIEDCIRMLDNVLETFIQKAPEAMWRAKESAYKERSIGLGVLGWHTFLQQENIPFDSAVAIGWTNKIFEKIKKEAVDASEILAFEKGEAPDLIGTGRRHAHLLAIAPTASNSIICGTVSPGIEPISTNYYIHKTNSGSFPVRNKTLEKRLEEIGRNDKETWDSILANKGSVQHLDVPQDIKDVFKTAFELNQSWIIEQAATRQKYICQGQSINLFFDSTADRKDINNVHLAAWERGLKGLYYLRSQSSKRAENVGQKIEREIRKDYEEFNTESDCVACEG